LYMSSSTSSAPSITTTSSLSRADSLSSLEYLHGSHPLHHSHANRHLSGSVSGSTTTGSTSGSSFGHSVASGSVSSGGSSSVYLHHSTGLGRANLNAAIRHQRNPHDSSASSTATTTRIGGDASSTADASQRVNGKSGSTSTSASAGTEQGRNSTKRAAQNRAAQRAFRQRKDLYVRELERKAELLQQAEGKILRLTARNRELEVALASGNPSSNSSLSPQQSPLHSHASPTTGLVCAAGSSSSSGDQEQQHPPQQLHQTLHHSSSREQLDRKGSEWNRGSDEKPSSLPGRDPEVFDDSSSNHSGHSYPSSLSRATLARRSVSQPMRSAYNASSPPLTNDSLKFHSLKQQLAANQPLNLPHSQPRHPQQQQHLPLRTDSDYEFEVVDQSPHRQLHRHPSEPSLNQSRRGSNSADSGDDYATSGNQKHTHQQYPLDLSRSHGPRRSSVDSRMELTSPIFHNQQSSSLTYRSNNGVSTGSRLLPSEYPESSSPPSSAQPYTSNNGSNGNPQQQQRPPLYPIATQAGSRSVPLGSARSWGSGAQQEDGMKPHSPMITSPVAGRSGGMAASAGSPTKGYGSGSAASRTNDMEYLSDERSETNGFDGMNKRSSDGAISWSGSNSSGGRGGPPGPEPQSSPHEYSGGGLGLRKESSWSSFSAISKEGFNASSGGGGGPNPVSLPPVSALAAAPAGRERSMSDDMEIQDSYHHPRPSQHVHQNHDEERRLSGTDANGNSHRGSMAMMADSPEMVSSLEGRFHNNNTAPSVTTPQMLGRQQQQQQYFPSQQHHASPFAPHHQQHHHQQHQQNHPQQRQHHPLSPANEYAPSTSDMDGVYDRHHHHHHHQQQQPHHQLRYHTNNHSGIAAGYHEEAMMRSP
ncbi:hypothetical protein BGZ95_004002, partial [Linnemannia exigua]